MDKRQDATNKKPSTAGAAADADPSDARPGNDASSATGRPRDGDREIAALREVAERCLEQFANLLEALDGLTAYHERAEAALALFDGRDPEERWTREQREAVLAVAEAVPAAERALRARQKALGRLMRALGAVSAAKLSRARTERAMEPTRVGELMIQHVQLHQRILQDLFPETVGLYELRVEREVLRPLRLKLPPRPEPVERPSVPKGYCPVCLVPCPDCGVS